MTFGSLFSGIGGLDIGLERAGMSCKWQVEKDDFCRKVLAKHWPLIPKFTDARLLSGNELSRVDLICGGFPCQDVSLAGLRKGIGSDTRSGLYSEFIRLVNILRPTFVLMENVTGLLVPIEPGQPAPIARVLGDLSEIGFDAEWDCLPAASFGAPHIRDRVFILAYPNCNYGRNEASPIKAHIQERKRKILHQGETQRYSGVCIPCGFIDASSWWHSEPGVDRVANGVPFQMDRLRSLGNAVTPVVAQWIGERIAEVATTTLCPQPSEGGQR